MPFLVQQLAEDKDRQNEELVVHVEPAQLTRFSRSVLTTLFQAAPLRSDSPQTHASLLTNQTQRWSFGRQNETINRALPHTHTHTLPPVELHKLAMAFSFVLRPPLRSASTAHRWVPARKLGGGLARSAARQGKRLRRGRPLGRTLRLRFPSPTLGLPTPSTSRKMGNPSQIGLDSSPSTTGFVIIFI